MARLNASATIHPLSVYFLLVSVEDDAGEPVKLERDDFSVQMWASTTQIPGSPGYWVPVKDVTNIFFDPQHTFWQLTLGDQPFVDHIHGEEITTYVDLPTLGPLVYLVSIDSNGGHGQAIACACCLPAGGGSARPPG